MFKAHKQKALVCVYGSDVVQYEQSGTYSKVQRGVSLEIAAVGVRAVREQEPDQIQLAIPHGCVEEGAVCVLDGLIHILSSFMQPATRIANKSMNEAR